MKNAIIAAVVSALVSASGTLAASHYVITSTKQIKPSVLRTLEKSSRTLGAVPAAAPGATGPQGSAGERGAKGDPGDQGAQGFRGEASTVPGPEGPQGHAGSAYNNVHIYEATSTPLAPGEHRAEGIEARCPEGSRPVGGGYEASEPHIHVYASQPNTANLGWGVAAVNESATNEGTIRVIAVCAE